MKPLTRSHARLLVALAFIAVAAVTGVRPAAAAEATVGLGTVGSYAVLAGSTVTNTGPTTLRGDLGVSPGNAITGFPPGTVSDGTTHAGDAHAASAQAALTNAYNDAAGRSSSGSTGPDLGGKTLIGGVYTGGAVLLTGTLTLDGGGDPDAVFIFQASSTLKTASASSVQLIGDARACNVFWQVGSSATLGTSSDFVGTILAQTSITAGSGAVIEGRLLARAGAVTLDDNDVKRTTCAAASSSSSSSTTTAAQTTTSPPTTSSTATTTARAAQTTTSRPTTSSTATTTAGAAQTTTSGPTTSTTSITSIAAATSTTSTTASSTTATSTPATGLTDRGAPVGPVPVVAPGSVDVAATGVVTASGQSEVELVTLPRTGLPLGALSALAVLSIMVGLVLVRLGQRPLVPPVARLRQLAR